jgi:hypothetical protein
MSNRDESNVDSTEQEQRERLKLKLMGKIDFANKTQTVSDGSTSPHLRSLYSRQAHLASPADFVKRNIHISEYSSNKSVDPYSVNNVERPKRFIAQGLALTTLGYSNTKTDQELPAVPWPPGDYLEQTKSPAFRYRELRDMLHKNQTNKYTNQSNRIGVASMIYIKTTPADSIQSSTNPETKNNPMMTPQMTNVKRKLGEP